MNRIFSFLALALVTGAATAAPTSIAQVPLLNISGTGSVKPNLMLLYDNSGSMDRAFTPDYLGDNTTCRGRATMAGGSLRSCTAGDPPFNSPDFNKQSYNPKVLYSPPVGADGLPYLSLNRANTTDWTKVTIDGFGVNNRDLVGAQVTTTNLVTGFPDLKWCEGSSNCGYNTTTYTYPNDTRNSPQSVQGNPYYYRINVAEYCTDASLTNCKSTSVGAAAPTGYPSAARVRWCNSTDLTQCQAKYVGAFKYPRFSDPNRPADWFGTITIGRTGDAAARTITSVSAVGPGGTFVITNGVVNAGTGTDTAVKQADVALALAGSIVARTGLADQYSACVRTPGGSGVPACSSFGITLDSDNVVAVVPISCPAGATSKAIGTCTLVSDGSRAGRDLMVSSGTAATALLTISGSANATKNRNQVLSDLRLGSTQLLSSSLTLALGASSTTIAQNIASKIGTSGAIRAYVGGASGAPAQCAGVGTSTVCLVAATGADGDNITIGTPTNNGSKPSYLKFTTTAAVTDGVPTDTTALGASVFARTDIVATRTSYPKDPSRSDCAADTCSYDEEMTNFANWYGYYRTRNQMMKTAVGQAFRPLTDNYKIGLVSLSTAASSTGTIKPPKKFTGDDRIDWYKRLYAMNTSGSTPIRLALHAIGMMYANKAPVAVAGEEVVEFPCQQNFTFVTTDGYWNGDAAADVTSNDNKEDASRFCLRSTGCVDTATQSFNSLADVALYWYNGGSNNTVTSLRSSLEDWTRPGLVPAASGENTRLHMNTYALGLGVDGIMTYEQNYDKKPDPDGDFYKLITGVTSGCPWNNNGPYVWPNPDTSENSGSATLQSRVDDLWHAAINGHGKYFSASDPRQVVTGLSAALANIEVKIGAAAAAATSTPNISQADNDIFSATFTTVRWFGELSDRKIDPVTGLVGKTVAWNSSNKLGKMVAADTDSRSIKMLDVDNGGLKDFVYSTDPLVKGLNPVERSWFDKKCDALAQCASLSASDRMIVDSGANIVGWLRGRQQYANDTVMRAYARTAEVPAGETTKLPIVLGDIASSKPAYVREPRKAYPDKEYGEFKAANAGRAATVYAAANDGMLHAFDAASGGELWAYMPRITMKKLHAMASINYGTNHQFSTDGSPEVADVLIDSAWRTVLVAGLNAGGRGYYAVDVTDPAEPKALWELCADADICKGVNNEPDLGLTFGNPQFGTWNDGTNKRWVVFLTSGYNNVPKTDGVAGGSGKGYLFVVDVKTGEVLKKVETPGTDAATAAATPTGLAKITAITNNPASDPLVTYVYGGDNQGQMWRFDFTAAGSVGVLKMSDAGAGQPITTRPDVTTCEVIDNSGARSTQRMVAFGTGRLLDTTDVSLIGVQSAYVLKDSGTAISSAQLAKQVLAKTSGAGGDTYTISGSVNLATQAGWYVDFDQNKGERVNLDPKIVSGGLNIVTNLPSSSSSCSLGGTSNVYQLNVCTGSALDNKIAGYTLSNNAAAVGFIIVRLPSGALKMITTTADGNTVTSGVGTATFQGASKAGWRRVHD